MTLIVTRRLDFSIIDVSFQQLEDLTHRSTFTAAIPRPFRPRIPIPVTSISVYDPTY